MERAVAVMKRTVGESRADGKVAPLVGAVIELPDGSVHEAARGELRDGDHAEFTLLERKLRAVDLTDAVLFSTLEPCAPGARRHPKLPCSERVVLARIGKVFVGIEDPDPTVDRKGIKYLQEHGVIVEMFDRDLQDQIRTANGDFLRQAEERASVDRSKADEEEVQLSSLEDSTEFVLFEDLSDEALEEFRTRSGFEDPIRSADFKRRLQRLQLLSSDDPPKPTKSGLILFGRSPREAMPQVGLLGTLHFPDGSEEVRDFDGPQALVPEDAMSWLRSKLPVTLDRTKAVAGQRDEPLLQSIREGIVNALVHRDYERPGAKCQLSVTSDLIEIRSPGLPVSPVTLQQLQTFSAPMLSRNPIIHYVFRQMHLAEERGLGLKTIRERLASANLPAPTYTFEDPYLVLRIFRRLDAVTVGLPDHVANALGELELAGWNWLRRQRPRWVQTPEYAETLGIDNQAARRDLKKLIHLGLVEQEGRTRGSKYRATEFQPPPSLRGASE